MKEIKLWEVNEENGKIVSINSLKSINQTKTEHQLEEVLVKHPELLHDGLSIVGRQTKTGGGPLDLLGVDADGRLMVFELKRGILTRDAVAQIIDYASYLADMERSELAEHISERSGNLGVEKIEDFAGWYEELHQKSIYDIPKPAMVLIGLGADERTRRMVSFLANNEINISLITFYGFEENGKTYLARQVEVSGKPPGAVSALSKSDRIKNLKEKIQHVGVGEFFETVAEFFENYLGAYKWPNQSGYSFYLQDFKEDGSPTNLVYISLCLNEKFPKRAEIRIQPRAIETAPKFFEEFQEGLSLMVTDKESGGAGVWISSLKEWESVAGEFQKLCAGIQEGWKEKRKIQAGIED